MEAKTTEELQEMSRTLTTTLFNRATKAKEKAAQEAELAYLVTQTIYNRVPVETFWTPGLRADISIKTPALPWANAADLMAVLSPRVLANYQHVGMYPLNTFTRAEMEHTHQDVAPFIVNAKYDPGYGSSRPRTILELRWWSCIHGDKGIVITMPLADSEEFAKYHVRSNRAGRILDWSFRHRFSGSFVQRYSDGTINGPSYYTFSWDMKLELPSQVKILDASEDWL